MDAMIYERDISKRDQEFWTLLVVIKSWKIEQHLWIRKLTKMRVTIRGLLGASKFCFHNSPLL